MSVTFSVPTAKISYQSTPCDFPGCVPGNRCGYCDDGVETQRVSEAPEANFANVNARALLVMLALPTDDYLCGAVEASVVPMVRATIFTTLNLRRLRAPADRETKTTRGSRGLGCTIIEAGNTDEDTMRRLMDLDAVFAWAEEHSTTVSWG